MNCAWAVLGFELIKFVAEVVSGQMLQIQNLHLLEGHGRNHLCSRMDYNLAEDQVVEVHVEQLPVFGFELRDWIA